MVQVDQMILVLDRRVGWIVVVSMIVASVNVVATIIIAINITISIAVSIDIGTAIGIVTIASRADMWIEVRIELVSTKTRMAKLSQWIELIMLVSKVTRLIQIITITGAHRIFVQCFPILAGQFFPFPVKQACS